MTSIDSRPPLYSRSWSVSGAAAAPPTPPTTPPRPPSHALSVMQFNVLADSLCAKLDNYGCFAGPRDAMEWEQRGVRLMEEVTRHGELPDLVAMEEVDHFADWFEPQLAALGYAGTWSKKTGKRSRDGCALFWRTSKLALRGDVETLRYSVGGQIAILAAFDFVRSEAALAAAATASAAVSEAVSAVVRSVEASSSSVTAGGGGGAAATPPCPPPPPLAVAGVFVAVTHLKASKNAEGEAIRTVQLSELFDRVAAARAGLPCLIALDMNAAPASSACAPYAPSAYPTALAHALGVHSTYATALGAEPAYTTWKIRVGDFKSGEAKHTIDYIFATTDIAVERVLRMPAEGDVVATRLPGWEYPSDHIALYAALRVPGC